ncbi:unnamed protein product [Brassica rapa]|uniref:Uncharacterized protein n=1 Tax=Brassica campestris TaxID=3711 RepID=A0A8D9CR91_BRACM|nr:unnamed protein product [Brassica rapa]
MDSHRHPVCADGHRRHVCTGGHPRTQPTWAKITRTIHGKGQRAESKDQSADIHTDVLCVLKDTHGCHLCADGHTRTHTYSHGRPVCADGQPRTAMDVLRVLVDTHGRRVCTEQTAHVGQKSPKHSTRRANVLSPRTNVLICVLMDSHGRPVGDDGHTRTHTDVLCVLTDTHGRPVCADGHPRTSCVC